MPRTSAQCLVWQHKGVDRKECDCMQCGSPEQNRMEVHSRQPSDWRRHLIGLEYMHYIQGTEKMMENFEKCWFYVSVHYTISSVENQKGAISIKISSIESQKGATAGQCLDGNSTLLVLNRTSLNIDSTLLVLNITYLNSGSALLALKWQYMEANWWGVLHVLYLHECTFIIKLR